ncbi:HNH endonuclease [Acinetobacter oleivorans]|uniref:HNH endonuclease n=1 Tax=Acinetobacter oleivorans TaxID=1148157 RepID=UPI003A8C55A0
MIKLHKKPKPSYLTAIKIKELTDRFKANNKDTVWKHSSIHSKLLESSSSKCAFCESPLQISATYMEIEHFKLKDKYPDEVVEWENLLPSCKRCNTSKGNHDVVSEPIINPFETDPKDHLSYAACRFYFKTELGEVTRDVLNLNDERLMRPRFEVWNFIVDSIEDIHSQIINKTNLSRHDRNKLVKLLTFCQSDQAFSAFASTALHNSPEYAEVKQILKREGLWDEDLETLHQKSIKLVIDKRY